MLDEITGRSHAAIGQDGQYGHTAPVIVRDKNMLVRLVHAKVAGARAPRRLLIQEGQGARLGVDGESAQGAVRLTVFVDRIKVALRRVEHQERWLDLSRHRAQMLQSAVGGIQTIDIDPLARPHPRVGTHENENLPVLYRGHDHHPPSC